MIGHKSIKFAEAISFHFPYRYKIYVGDVWQPKMCIWVRINKPEDRWSCIAHLSAKDMLNSEVIEEKQFKNIDSKWFGPRSINDFDHDHWYS